MQALIVLTLTFGLLWVLFLLPQKRQVRAHQQLVAELNEGDDVILSAGIHGRITRLGAEELQLEVAPGVELRVARQAVLRRAEPHDPTESIESLDSLHQNETPDPPAGDRV
jgi:preprotein translocase subunit YajC